MNNKKITNRVEVKNGKILYTLERDGAVDYLTYNDALFAILHDKRLKPFRDEGRLRLKIRLNGIDRNWYLYDLAYACYHGMAKPDSVIEDMQRYYADKALYELSIDHADGVLYNNTELNLSLMPLKTNMEKSDIAARIKYPNYLSSAYCDGEYRVLYTSVTDAERAGVILENMGIKGCDILSVENATRITYLCPDAKSYVDFLREIADISARYGNILRNSGKQGKWLNPSDEYVFEQPEVSMRMQEMIANMDRSEFC